MIQESNHSLKINKLRMRNSITLFFLASCSARAIKMPKNVKLSEADLKLERQLMRKQAKGKHQNKGITGTVGQVLNLSELEQDRMAETIQRPKRMGNTNVNIQVQASYGSKWDITNVSYYLFFNFIKFLFYQLENLLLFQNCGPRPGSLNFPFPSLTQSDPQQPDSCDVLPNALYLPGYKCATSCQVIRTTC